MAGSFASLRLFIPQHSKMAGSFASLRLFTFYFYFIFRYSLFGIPYYSLLTAKLTNPSPQLGFSYLTFHMKHIYLIFLSLLTCQSLSATHIIGGSISYKQVG